MHFILQNSGGGGEGEEKREQEGEVVVVIELLERDSAVEGKVKFVNSVQP